jgi:hypothetical protein
MTEVSITHEFPSSLHVKVSGAKSERSAVQLSRNFASKHYGTTVGHWVSGGGGTTDGEIYYTYVYSNPSYVEPEVAPVPEPVTPLVMPATRYDSIVMPLKLRSTRYSAPSSPAPKPAENARLRRAQKRSRGYSNVSRMLAHA